MKETKVVGVSYREQKPYTDYSGEIKEVDGVPCVYSQALLVPEPTNPHDSNAVKVLGRLSNNEAHFIGYLPKDSSSQLQTKSPVLVNLIVKAYSTIKDRSYSDSYIVYK